MDAFEIIDDTLEALDVGELPPPFYQDAPRRFVTWSVRSRVTLTTHLFPRVPPFSHNNFFDETPTTAAASLPTPSLDPLALRAPPAYGDAWYVTCVTRSSPLSPYHPLLSMPWHSHLGDSDILPLSVDGRWEPQPPYEPPGAPLLKDRDSFTDGTTRGSFDFSLPPSPNSLHYPLELPEPLPLCPEDTARSIESWRDDVVLSIAGPDSRLSGDDNNEPHDLPRGIKRHRSSTFSDGDRDEDEQACRGSLQVGCTMKTARTTTTIRNRRMWTRQCDDEKMQDGGGSSSRWRRRWQQATRWQQQQRLLQQQRQRGVDDGSSRAAATQQRQQLQQLQGGVDDVRWWRQWQQGQQGSGSMHQFLKKLLLLFHAVTAVTPRLPLYREYKRCGVHP